MVVQDDKYLNDPTAWFQNAMDAHRAARLLFQHDALLWFPAALLGHRALEMFLKAALIRQGHQINSTDVWGHDLVALIKTLVADGVTNVPEDILETLRLFNDYFDELRYPQQLQNVSKLGEKEANRLEDAIKFLLPYALGKLEPPHHLRE